MIPEPTDEELVAGALTGVSTDFEPIMRRYNQRLFRTVRAIVASDGDAEDVLQETYISVYRHLDQFAGRAKLSTWLTRIAINAAVGHARKQQQHQQRQQVVPAEEPVLSSDEGPEQGLARAQLRRMLETSIDALPEAHRTVFMLREVEGLSSAETAACLEIDEQNVRKRLQRARDTLKTVLLRVQPAEAHAFAGHRCDRIVAGVLSKLAAGTG